MKIIKGGVTAAKDFKAQGIACGIKSKGKLDLGLIYSENPCAVAAVFTQNSVVAAPVVVCKEHAQNQKAQALIVNSGNANCFTGEFGLRYARETTKLVAKCLDISYSDVLVASTGIIGKPLPIKPILMSMSTLAKGLSPKGNKAFAESILTTDTGIKECAVEVVMSNRTVRIGGCSKGSGMIEPNMATMLGFITTDAHISPEMLKKALLEATELSFNRITVDGCISTNDMVSLMANGKAGNVLVTKANDDYQIFCEGLKYVCLELAKKIVLDGEGATKFVQVKVTGAVSDEVAKRVAKAVANSVLVKTAIFGENSNWGRVAAAVGSVGANIKEEDIRIEFSPFDRKEIEILIELSHGGSSEAVVYTCDLSYDYIKINAEYN